MSAHTYSFGDVVLVPFPFTDQTATKKRPAVVVSSDAYNAARPDVVVMAITSQVRTPPPFGDIILVEWKRAGLLRPSVVKPIFTTIERSLVLRNLGALESSDQAQLRNGLRSLIG